MSTEEPFFCFPIGLLGLSPEKPEETLSRIIDWSVGSVANTTFANYNLEELKGHARRREAFSHAAGRPQGVGQYRLLLAANTLHVVYYTRLDDLQHKIRTIDRYLSGVSVGARNNTVRVKGKWLWDCFKTVMSEPVDRTLSWREFQILCAVLSKVGAKGIKTCGWFEVQARAAGFCGKRDMTECVPEERKRRKKLIYSRTQIRTTLRRLESDGFFARYNFGRNGSAARESWFSFSMPREDLTNAVNAKKKRRDDRIAANRKQDQQAANVEQPTDSQH